MPVVTLPSGQKVNVFLSPCVSVIIGNQVRATEIESAIHAALRDDPRYLFVTLTGDRVDSGWKLSVQWGTAPESRNLPEIQLTEHEHSAAQVVGRLKQELAKLSDAR
jgi:hypothetical protein